jgi:O-antigen/teichoic acid export membrane protein
MTEQRHTAKIVHGMSLLVLTSVAARAIVLVAQLILGYLLSPTDFGLYALALSISNSVWALRNGGTAQVMIQRGLHYREGLSEVTQYSLIVNIIALVILLAVAPLAGAANKMSDIGWLIIAIGLSFPMGTFGTVFRTELSIMGRFKQLAFLNTLSVGLWQLEVVILAAFGFGAYSFAIPMVLQSIIDGVLGWLYVRRWPLRGPLIRWPEFASLFRETRWIMLGLATMSLGLTGHYFAAGLFLDPATVGVFFFGFQLAFTFFTILNNGIDPVLPAALAHLNAEPQQQSRTTMDMLEMLMTVSLPLTGALALCAPTAIHLLWHGRWDRSAGVVSITALSIPAWVGIAIVRAVLEARGMWLERLGLLAIYGIGTFVVVAAAAATHDLTVISACLSAFYAIYSVVLLAALPALTGVPLWNVMGAFLKPLVLCVGCALLACLSQQTLPAASSETLKGLLGALVFALGALITNWLLFGKVWKSALAMLFGHKPRIA